MKQTPSASTAVFAPPSHGMWELETTHHGLRPLSPFLRDAYKRGFEAGTTALLKRWGLPLSGIRAELVNGCIYVRPTAVGEGNKPSPMPPKLIMKLIVRVHPEMRRRSRTAAQAWKERRWRAEVDQWFNHDRTEIVAQNLAFQSVNYSTLNNAQLASHVTELLAHFEEQARKNMENHGGDLMPVGDLLAHCSAWGIDPGEAVGLSPAAPPQPSRRHACWNPSHSRCAIATPTSGRCRSRKCVSSALKHASLSTRGLSYTHGDS